MQLPNPRSELNPPEVYPYWMIERPYSTFYAQQVYDGMLSGPGLPSYATPKTVYTNLCHYRTPTDITGPSYSMWKPMYPVYNNYPLKPNTGIACAPACKSCQSNFNYNKGQSYSMTPCGRPVPFPTSTPPFVDTPGRNCSSNSVLNQLTSSGKKYLNDYYRPPVDVSDLRRGNIGSYPTLL